MVYPSAFTEDVEVQGLGTDVTFTEAYYGHISMFCTRQTTPVRPEADVCVAVMFPTCCGGKHPPRCPFEFLQEPPPVYEK